MLGTLLEYSDDKDLGHFYVEDMTHVIQVKDISN